MAMITSCISSASSHVKNELTSPCKPDEHLRAVLAGATSKSATARKSNDPARPKRKYRSRARARSPGTIQKAKTVRRAKANDRERNRMHSLNGALETLRTKLPCAEEEGKMTKIETLTLAHQYIRVLTETLTMSDEDRLLFDPSARLQAIWREFQAAQAMQAEPSPSYEMHPAAMMAPSVDSSFSSGYSPSPPNSSDYPVYPANPSEMGYGIHHQQYQHQLNPAHQMMTQYSAGPAVPNRIGEENFGPNFGISEIPQMNQWTIPPVQDSFYSNQQPDFNMQNRNCSAYEQHYSMGQFV